MKKSGYQRGFTIVELLIVIVVIAILAAIVIVSYNGITSQAREAVRKSDIASWKQKSEVYKAERDIVCPENWVFVYGNPAIPGSKDFCVMKYEAKNVGGVATSRADELPWTNITRADATAEAQAIGEGAHLVTETEWMTLAADVLSVKYNWSGGAVGSGFVYGGHSDNVPANTLAATTNDEDGYFATGDQAPGTQRRTLYLKSGDVIWDAAGDAYEMTDATINGPQPGVSEDSATGAPVTWKEYTQAIIWPDVSIFPAVSRVDTLASVPGLEGIAGWNSTQGIGQLSSNMYQTGLRGFVRGGNYGLSTRGGILTLSLNNLMPDANAYTGFRVAR